MVGSRFRVVPRLRPQCPQKVGHCHIIYCRAYPYPGDVHTFRSRGLWPTFGLTEIDSLPGERTLRAGPSECGVFLFLPQSEPPSILRPLLLEGAGRVWTVVDLVSYRCRTVILAVAMWRATPIRSRGLTSITHACRACGACVRQARFHVA
jgi:hypothetical protein